jgi:hypothetical protein
MEVQGGKNYRGKERTEMIGMRGRRKLDRKRKRTEEKRKETEELGESREVKPVERQSKRDFRSKEKKEWRSRK